MIRKAVWFTLVPLLVLTALPAHADSKSWGKRFIGYGIHHHYDRSHHRPSIGYTSPARQHRGIGTFSRSVWVSSRFPADERPQFAPLAIIIHVSPPGSFRSTACSYEAGVCVIRAGN